MNKPLLILFLFIISKILGQTYIDVTNQYIQNPSFEEYTACPQSNSIYPGSMWIDSVVGWNAPTAGTSDYFNSCSPGGNNTPNGYLSGYQVPFEGDGFCGFYAYAADYTQNDKMWCEYIQSKLIQPLTTNQRYKFSMRVNRANDYNLAVQQIGANFTQNSNTNFTNTKPFNTTPTVLNNTGYITDTLGWILVEGEFEALGNENYITIGWFGDTITSDYLFFIPPEIDTITGDSLYLKDTYYLVDSLKLFEIQFNIDDFNLNVITPNNDGINDYIDFSKYELSDFSFKLLNRWGNVIWETNDINTIWDGKSSSQEKLSEGTYFYYLKGKNNLGVEISKNGFVQVIR